MMDHRRTIAVDVDDTICVTENRDYSNSKPVMPVIEQLRKFGKKGWRIVLHTARGMGRSNGDIESVRAEVLEELAEFCWKHGVPYDEIHLGKPWAAMYVDDKAIRPDEFAVLDPWEPKT